MRKDIYDGLVIRVAKGPRSTYSIYISKTVGTEEISIGRVSGMPARLSKGQSINDLLTPEVLEEIDVLAEKSWKDIDRRRKEYDQGYKDGRRNKAYRPTGAEYLRGYHAGARVAQLEAETAEALTPD